MSGSPEDGRIALMAETLRVLGHELRLSLMQSLHANGEKSVGELEALTGITQPGLSQQLTILRKAELVKTRRESKLVFYSVDAEKLRQTALLLSDIAQLKGSTEPAKPAPRPQSQLRGSAASFAKLI